MYVETRSEFKSILISAVASNFGAPLPAVVEQLKLYRVPIVGNGHARTVTANALSTWLVHCPAENIDEASMPILSREMIARSAEIPVEYFYTEELLSRLPKPIQTEKILLWRGSEVRPLLQESEDAPWLSQRTLRKEFGLSASQVAWLIEQRVLPPTRVQGIAAGWHDEMDLDRVGDFRQKISDLVAEKKICSIGVGELVTFDHLAHHYGIPRHTMLEQVTLHSFACPVQDERGSWGWPNHDYWDECSNLFGCVPAVLKTY